MPLRPVLLLPFSLVLPTFGLFVSSFRDKDLWIYTSEEELIELEEMGWVKEKISYLHFPTSKIGLSFFIPEKRKKMVAKKYLIKI